MDLSTNSVQDVNITVAAPPAVAITVPAVVTVDMPITGVGGIKGDKGDKGDAGSPGTPGTTDYNALSNKPTIPTTTSQLTNNSGFLTSYTETDPVFIASPAHNITSTHITTLGNTSGTNTGDETSTTIKTKLGISTLSGSNTGDQDLSSYATTSALTSGLAGRQATLVSGTNIKTINGTTVLGSGDITISGGTSSDATTSAKGIIQLAGDLGGTATSPTVLKINGATPATVATSGSYTDLSNKPTIPAAQVNSDWNAATGVAQILNKPSLATVATTGSYTDLTSKPTIPTANSQLTNDSGYITGAGNAATATKLATPRAINGVNFDGTAAITVVDSTKVTGTMKLSQGTTAPSSPATGDIWIDTN